MWARMRNAEKGARSGVRRMAQALIHSTLGLDPINQENGSAAIVTDCLSVIKAPHALETPLGLQKCSRLCRKGVVGSVEAGVSASGKRGGRWLYRQG